MNEFLHLYGKVIINLPLVTKIEKENENDAKLFYVDGTNSVIIGGWNYFCKIAEKHEKRRYLTKN